MRGSPIPILRAAPLQGTQVQGVLVGTFLGCNAAHEPLVTFPGAPHAQIVARLAGYEPEFAAAPEQFVGRKLLLAFEGGDALQPLILGLVRETLATAPAPESRANPSLPGEAGQALTVNGRSLHFDAQEEIVFRCGQGSITVRADGSILIKGTKLMSRASEVNKIRGASVQIN